MGWINEIKKAKKSCDTATLNLKPNIFSAGWPGVWEGSGAAAHQRAPPPAEWADGDDRTQSSPLISQQQQQQSCCCCCACWQVSTRDGLSPSFCTVLSKKEKVLYCSVYAICVKVKKQIEARAGPQRDGRWLCTRTRWSQCYRYQYRYLWSRIRSSSTRWLNYFPLSDQ